MSKNTGGPAFPRAAGQITEHLIKDSKYNLSQEGMTLRQCYVGQALAGLASKAAVFGDSDVVVREIGVFAVRLADSALAEEAK